VDFVAMIPQEFEKSNKPVAKGLLNK